MQTGLLACRWTGLIFTSQTWKMLGFLRVKKRLDSGGSEPTFGKWARQGAWQPFADGVHADAAPGLPLLRRKLRPE